MKNNRDKVTDSKEDKTATTIKTIRLIDKKLSIL